MLEKTKKVLKEQKKKKLPSDIFGPAPNLAQQAKDAIDVAKALKEDIQDTLEKL